MYHLSLSQGLASQALVWGDLTHIIERHSALAYLIQTKFQFLNTLHLFTAVTLLHHYACTTSACTKLWRLRIVLLLEILTPSYNGTLSIPYKQIFFSRHPPFVTSTLCTSLCMYHLSLSQVYLKHGITWDIDSAILWTALSALAYLIQTKFQFLNTLHLLRGCTLLCTSLCMYHLSLSQGLASQA
jgi:hypothetical protein